MAHDDDDDKERARDDRPALHTLTMRRVIATFTGLLSVFFVFWFVRLLVVTGFLQHVRPGGGGAYMGCRLPSAGDRLRLGDDTIVATG